MRRLFFLLVIIALSTNISTINAQGIDFFHGTWEEAKSLAAEQNKIIFVDAYASWCGPCKKMAKYEFTKEDVGNYFNDNFINYKIDMEKGEGPAFGSKYPVSAYPTLLFIDGHGELQKKIVGGRNSIQLIALGKEVMSTYDYAANDRAAYEKGDRSFETVINYIKGLNKSNKPSLKIANEYLSSDHQMTPTQMDEFVYESATEVDSKIFSLFEKAIPRLNKKYGKEAVDERIKKATLNTVNKAIEFQYPALVEEAEDRYKSAINNKDEAFIEQLYTKFAFADVNPQILLDRSKQFFKVADINQKFEWGNNVLAIFKSNEELMNVAIKKLKKPASKTTNYEHIVIYTKLLMSRDKEKAADYLSENMNRIEHPQQLNYLKQLLNSIK